VLKDYKHNKIKHCLRAAEVLACNFLIFVVFASVRTECQMKSLMTEVYFITHTL